MQGRDEAAAQTLRRHARELGEAGAAMVVFELMPSALAAELAAELPMPVIGIGAGPGCAGQVLVLHDMLGVTHGRLPRFVHDFMAGAGSVDEAVRRYVAAVKEGSFPDPERHGY